jgi:hypothetical protein
MLQFKNETPFPGAIAVMPNADAVTSIFTVVKGTFSLGGQLTPAKEQLPIAHKDEFRGEPDRSSLKVAADIALTKPGTDVLLVGHGYAPAGRPTTQMDVSLTVGALRKTVRLIGDRTWRSGIFGGRATQPQPFERMPLIWERAFGGSDASQDQPSTLYAEERNPVGVGFRIKDGRNNLDDLPLPNLEDPRQLITSWKDRPAPAGFGPICAPWKPRKTYAGTYDDAWQKGRAPYLPKDFDPRFFQVAPPDQVIDGYLKGGEPVEVIGATPGGPLMFHLPELSVQVVYRLDGEDHASKTHLDTVVIEPDDSRLVLVWRSSFACDKKVLEVSQIRVGMTSERSG